MRKQGVILKYCVYVSRFRCEICHIFAVQKYLTGIRRLKALR